MSASRKNAYLLVLESDWGEDLVDCRSTRPFLEGLASALDITVVYRSFHTGRDLQHWLHEMFMAPGNPSIAYVSSHGSGRFLQASLHDAGIDLRRVLAAASRGTRRSHGRRGLLLGACEVGRDLPEILAASRGRLDWIAGYEREVPWVESTLIDLAFISYLVAGRRVWASNGKRSLTARHSATRTSFSQKAARWVAEDYGLAEALRFRALDRKPPHHGRLQQRTGRRSSS